MLPTLLSYYLPVDVDTERLKHTGLPFHDIKSTVQALAGKTLFFVDTCHSGNVTGKRRGTMPDITAIVNELTSAESGAFESQSRQCHLCGGSVGPAPERSEDIAQEPRFYL